MKIALFLLSTAIFASAQAAEPMPNLPSEAVVVRVLRESPAIQAAAAQVRAEEANRRRLEAGPHEWSVRLGSQQRKTLPANASEQSFNEWNAAIERPLRLPGKGALDTELGTAGVDIASTSLGDARHEACRALLKGWFAWLRESASAQQWQAQVALLTQQDKAVQRRQQLGDAARIEAVQAAAAQAQAEAQLAQARARQRSAEEELRRQFPGLPLNEPAQLAPPQPLTGSEAEWQEAVLAHNHELAVAQGEARRAQLLADRARSERLPDPSVGVQYSRERGGEEKVLGAYLSIPLPGAARRASADAGIAQAEAWAARADAVHRKVSSEAASLYHNALAAYPGWQAAAKAAAQLGQSAEMTARAYQLGEGSLSEVLAARRLANESQLAARQAQLDALELRARLALDAHQLWDLDSD